MDQHSWLTERFEENRRFVQPALINGSVGVILAPRGQMSRALIFTFRNDKVTRLEAIGDPARLREAQGQCH